MSKSRVAMGVLGILSLWASNVRADPPPDVPAMLAAPTTTAAPGTSAPAVTPIAQSASRTHREQGQHFTLDPIADGVLTAAGFGFSLLLGEVLSTGEIKPPPPNVPVSSLLPLDRTAVSQSIDPNASTFSDIGLYSAVGFAVLDPVLSVFRDGWDAGLVDGFMYAESGSLALTLTDITKIAVRRPRPIDYINCPATTNASGQSVPSTLPSCDSSTDLGLSFFSGHAATVAAIGATATYIAFVRAPHSPRPWITLGVATSLTAFVAYERVRAGRHFPTDVIAGSAAGAAIGVLVPHLHRHSEEAPPVWVGIAPAPGGAEVGLNGLW